AEHPCGEKWEQGGDAVEIRAKICEGPHAQTQDAPLGSVGCLDVVDLPPPVRVGLQVLASVFDPLDRPPVAYSKGSRGDLLAEKGSFRAETTPDIGIDDMNAVGWQAQRRGQGVARDEERLRGNPGGELSRLGVKVEQTSARLQRARGDALIDQAELDCATGLREGRRDVPTTGGHTVDFVGADLRVEEWGAGTYRFLGVGDDGQRLVVNLDEEAGVIGSVTGPSQHDSDRIAGIANGVCRQHAPLGLLGAGHRGRRQRWQLLAKLTTSMRREDPRACESAFSLDRTD